MKGTIQKNKTTVSARYIVCTLHHYIYIHSDLVISSSYKECTSKLHVAVYSFVLHELIVLCDQCTDSMLYAPLITGSKVV